MLRVLIDDEPVGDEHLTGYLDAVLLPALGVADASVPAVGVRTR